MLKVTIDTNVYPTTAEARQELAALAQRHDLDIVIVSVSKREMKDSDIQVEFEEISEACVWGESPRGEARWGADRTGGKTISEAVVLGETPLGSGRLGTAPDVDLNEVLDVISNGSFPPSGKRKELSAGQRRQLRDAMILEAHIFHRRDVFVSNDAKAYIGKADGKRREHFERKYGVKIMTRPEFEAWLESTE